MKSFTLNFVFCLVAIFAAMSASAIELSHVKGFGFDTQGGIDGQVLKVVTTASEGPGSLRWAVQQKGARLVVFEVGGVIDLAKNSIEISEPYVTIAGETAPAPGITLIRGGISVRTNDVHIRHLMVRPGDNNEAKRSGWEPDGISASGALAHDVWIDHCSLTWAIDENASASGPRNKGRDATSSRIAFSNNIIAEGLDNSTHKKGKHSKGLLVHDFVQDVAIIGNLFAHNDRRNPYFKGNANGVVVNNLLYDIGNAAVQLGYVLNEYQGTGLVPKNPQVSVIGNILLYGSSTYSDLPLIAYQGDAFVLDNIVLNLDKLPMPQIYGDVKNMPPQSLKWPSGLQALHSKDLESVLLKDVGARPWDRDPIDKRIVGHVLSGEGKIIDSQNEVGGYPSYPETHRKLDVPEGDREAWLKSFAIGTVPR